MRPRSLTRFIATTLVAATVAAASLRADDVTNALKKAETAYESGNYSEAMSSLDYAGQLIRQKKGEAITKLLPEPLSGWSAEEPTTESAAATMFGGMITAQRQYSKEASSVIVKITTDSPLLSSFVGLLTSDTLVNAAGSKLETVNGQKAIVEFNKEEKRGEINVVVGEKLLVAVEGSDVTRQELTAYAAALDYTKLGALK